MACERLPSDQGKAVSPKAKRLAIVEADIEDRLPVFDRLNRNTDCNGMPLNDFSPDGRKIVAVPAAAVACVKQLPR